MELQPSALVTGFLRSIDRALSGNQARVVAVQLGRTTQAPTTSVVDRAPVQGPGWFDRQAIEASRYERYRDLREARTEIPEWERALQVSRGYAFSSQVGEGGKPLSFRLSFSRTARPEVVEACNGCTDRLDLHAVVPDIYDAGKWLGDSFDELVFDTRSRAITDLHHWEPERVIARVNRSTGRVSDYSIAVADDYNPTQPVGERVPVNPFQIVHYAPNRVRGAVYGRSMFAAGMKGRREYEAVNDMLVLASLQAIANQYLLWPFPREMAPDKMWSFVRRVRQSVELDLQFNKDGVLRRRLAKMIETSPKVMPYLVDPDLKEGPTPFQAPIANLRHLLDVAQWQQENNAVVSGVPLFLMGINRTVNGKATIVEESAQFAVAMMQDQTEIAQDVISTIYVRQLLALGIIPEPGEVKIDMFPPSQLYERMRADVAKVQAEAAKIMIDADLPVAFALKRAFGLADTEVTDVLGGLQTADVASADAVESFIDRAVEAAASRFGGRNKVSVDIASTAQPAVNITSTNQPPHGSG